MSHKIFAILIYVILFACQPNEKVTPGGLKFTVIRSGDGVVARKGEVVVFNYKLVDSNDSVWIDTYKRGYPVIDVIRDTAFASTEKGLKQMLRMVSVGDSIRVKYSMQDYFKDVVKKPITEDIDTTLRLVYCISIDSIMSRDEYRKWNFEKRAQQRQQQLDADVRIIDQYLLGKEIHAERTNAGIRYVINRQGKGSFPSSGQHVLVNYTGYLLDGRCFVSNIQSVAEEESVYDSLQKYEPLEVEVDRSLVIAGWHDALKVLNKGAKGTFYIPSVLAYGQQKVNELIKENEILIFEIEVLDIR